MSAFRAIKKIPEISNTCFFKPSFHFLSTFPSAASKSIQISNFPSNLRRCLRTTKRNNNYYNSFNNSNKFLFQMKVSNASSSSHDTNSLPCIDSKKKLSSKTFFLDDFALRQWNDPNYPGTKLNYDMESFVQAIENFYSNGYELRDGYAPFCKHLFVPNFVDAKVDCVGINNHNRCFLSSGYRSRTEKELSVLCRWFPEEKVEAPKAQILDIILYSRDQLEKEWSAMAEKETKQGKEESEKKEAEAKIILPSSPWGIICIKAQKEGFELPMQPITMMRNALGVKEGGSGVALDAEAYAKSVEYWEHHAIIMKE